MEKNTRSTIKLIFAALLTASMLVSTVSCTQKLPEETTEQPATSAPDVTVPVTEEETTAIPETEPAVTEAPDDGEALKEILLSSQSLKSKCKAIRTIYSPVSGAYPQGGYTDGKYVWQVFIQKDTASNEAANKDIIVKYDLTTGKTVKISKVLDLNHGNDITMTPDGLLAVVHNNPNRYTVSIIDPDELTLVKKVQLPKMIYCMAYCEAREKYVVGVSGGQNFCYLASTMQKGSNKDLLDKTATNLTTGYTTQGCTCDANFIYFVLYNKSVITVYDWDGKFVTLIELDVGKLEPENISVVGNSIYVTCANNGAQIYKVEPYAG